MLRNMTNQIKVDESIEKYIVSIVVASRTKDSRLLFSPYIQYGASPRATLALYKVAKARALLNQRDFVIPDDVKTVAYDVLRHRLVLSYEAEAADLSVNDVIEQLLSAVAVP
jgi:MoxR-like ATPase